MINIFKDKEKQVFFMKALNIIAPALLTIIFFYDIYLGITQSWISLVWALFILVLIILWVFQFMQMYSHPQDVGDVDIDKLEELLEEDKKNEM